jgi:ribose transport system ATP-binding protein
VELIGTMTDVKESTENSVYFETVDIDKKYPGVHAVNSISLKVRKNEILGIAGENGAGKSTLLKLISGVESPDSGEMFLRGKKYNPPNFRQANIFGVSMVFQEQNLIPNLYVYENIFLSHEEQFKRFGFLNRSRMISEASKYLESFDIDVDPAKYMSTYSFQERQMLEITRAFVIADMYGIEIPLILLDEPTASLPDEERDILLKKIRSFSAHGVLIFVSHRLSELMSFCDRIVILKDGQLVGELTPENSTESDIHSLMVGRELSADLYRVKEQKVDIEQEDVVMKVEELTTKGEYESISFELKKGEILGVGGILGSGKRELGELLFGIGKPDAGKITIQGNTVCNATINKMAKLGIGYVPAERKEYGIINVLSVAWNLSLPSLKTLRFGLLGMLNSRKENELIETAMSKFRVKANKRDICYSLSGGNQQKVVIAKWMIKNLSILILDNPTRGIDVGAKEEIYSFIRQMSKNGLSIILISDDLLELIGLSSRIIIMKDGKMSKIVAANPESKPTEEELVKDMV